ncbi:hypothetical protein CNMCM5623_001037 [Aspergillus felis]|uniref:Uncharacterized protein n=1 Tax=Aspergillus felis TaxID=1287682 RepID=A0A8H6UVU0_9EURO|nr:hypothetical protein CNMCM5623_001037 [Aspergillus felis]
MTEDAHHAPVKVPLAVTARGTSAMRLLVGRGGGPLHLHIMRIGRNIITNKAALIVSTVNRASHISPKANHLHDDGEHPVRVVGGQVAPSKKANKHFGHAELVGWEDGSDGILANIPYSANQSVSSAMSSTTPDLRSPEKRIAK